MDISKGSIGIVLSMMVKIKNECIDFWKQLKILIIQFHAKVFSMQCYICKLATSNIKTIFHWNFPVDHKHFSNFHWPEAVQQKEIGCKTYKRSMQNKSLQIIWVYILRIVQLNKYRRRCQMQIHKAKNKNVNAILGHIEMFLL